MVLSNKEWLDKMDEIISAIKNGGGNSQVIEDMLSNMWISSATYNVGDYVLYNNNIWKCIVQNSNIAPSEGTTWTRVNITSEISTLNSNFITLTATLGSVGTSIDMNYPTGFNPNNCIVSCAKLELATDVFVPNIYSGETMFDTVLFDTYIAFGTHSETAVGKKATIVLKKI